MGNGDPANDSIAGERSTGDAVPETRYPGRSIRDALAGNAGSR